MAKKKYTYTFKDLKRLSDEAKRLGDEWLHNHGSWTAYEKAYAVWEEAVKVYNQEHGDPFEKWNESIARFLQVR